MSDIIITNDSEFENESFNFEDLQSNLESQLEEQLSDLSDIELDFDKIGDPNALGDTISTVVWEQFINQIGVIAGEEFIKENKGLTLDLRDSAHIQTTENFQKGKIATHNQEINFQERYDGWRKNFYTDSENEYFTEANKSIKNKDKAGFRFNPETNVWEQKIKGKWKIKLKDEKKGYSYRNEFDEDRPTGSRANNTSMDHTVPVSEYVRNPKMNAFVDKDQQVKLANSETNLSEINSAANSSKSDLSVEEFLNNKRDGKTPDERFDFDKDLMIEKDKKQREDNDKAMLEGEKKAIETGKKSQKQEAFRIGGKALQAALMVLLAALVKKIIQKLIQWIASSKKNFKAFIQNLKDSISEFIGELKQHLINAADGLLTSIATAIFGPIINTIKKTWIFLKQGYKSVKEAVAYIKNPQNKGKSLSILMLEVGKIVTAGLTAGGAILIGNSIEAALMTIPGLGFPIPLLGSLASILGIFFGAITSGIIGALALNLIDRMIANKKKSLLTQAKIEKGQEILNTQGVLKEVLLNNLGEAKNQFTNSVQNRHSDLKNSFDRFSDVQNSIDITRTKNDDEIDDLFNLLNS
ncbi:AI-2E family transporter [Empedobacter falsenii]